jgi:hypothetical protein
MFYWPVLAFTPYDRSSVVRRKREDLCLIDFVIRLFHVLELNDIIGTLTQTAPDLRGESEFFHPKRIPFLKYEVRLDDLPPEWRMYQ